MRSITKLTTLCTLLFPLLSQQSVAAHDPECQTAWYKSSARNTCVGEDWTTQNPEGICNIRQTCQKAGFLEGAYAKERVTTGRELQNVSFPLAEVPTLTNCNGILKPGKC